MNLPPRLSKRVVQSSHDGVEFSLPLQQYREIIALAATLLTVAAVPTSLVLVAFPSANLFEQKGWWLVNEPLLATLWLTIGVSLASGSWLIWPLLLPERSRIRLRIEHRRIVVRRPGGDWAIPTRQLARIWVSSGSLRFEYCDPVASPTVFIPLPLDDSALTGEIAALVAELAAGEDSPDAIPPQILALRKTRGGRTAE